MRDVNGNADIGSTNNSSASHKASAEAKSKTASAKGDYIDFEEIK